MHVTVADVNFCDGLEWVYLFVCLFVWCLTTHQPLWVISVRRYLTKHDEDGESKNLWDKIKGMMMSLYNGN